MREHPIPQDVTGYRFHLIGSMTLKQFAELVVGVIMGLIVYKTNLPVFFKWPLLLSCVSLGFLVAFVPFEERPLDHWLLTFIKTLYKPTKFFWKRESSIPDAFDYQPPKKNKQPEVHADLSPARQKRIKEFIQSINTPTTTYDQWEQQNDQQVSAILSSFDEVDVPQQVSQSSVSKKGQKPNLKVRVRKMQPSNQQKNNDPDVSTQSEDNSSFSKSQDQNHQIKPTATKEQKPQTEQPAKEVTSSPQTTEVQPEQSTDYSYRTNVTQKSEESYNHTAETATSNRNLPFPSAPSQPNKLVGMVITPQEDMLQNAIVEIRNNQGQVMRAVKTNSLGQFFISTPLTNGAYFIDVEKEGFNFPTQKLELSGKIMDPLEIRAETN